VGVRLSLRYRLVFFDVDSTLAALEGIDFLAGGNPEVIRLTEAAMNGDIALDEVYGRRLEIIRPGVADVERLAAEYKRRLVPGAAEVIRRLLAEGAVVHLVTAGIEQAILPLAEHLGIRPSAVHAVRLDFDAGGAYAGYDRSSFLTRSGGKSIVIRDVRARSHGRAVLIGDGITDAEAAGAVDMFIGFGGVTMRERVRKVAGSWIAEASLAGLLPMLLEGTS
jgi:phosphoserine phosphatase